MTDNADKLALVDFKAYVINRAFFERRALSVDKAEVL
jgi:hypothetical protein